MDPNLRKVILQIWFLVKRTGAEHSHCLECTVAMVQSVRPQMQHTDARAAVQFVLRQRAV